MRLQSAQKNYTIKDGFLCCLKSSMVFGKKVSLVNITYKLQLREASTKCCHFIVVVLRHFRFFKMSTLFQFFCLLSLLFFLSNILIVQLNPLLSLYHPTKPPHVFVSSNTSPSSVLVKVLRLFPQTFFSLLNQSNKNITIQSDVI